MLTSNNRYLNSLSLTTNFVNNTIDPSAPTCREVLQILYLFLITQARANTTLFCHYQIHLVISHILIYIFFSFSILVLFVSSKSVRDLLYLCKIISKFDLTQWFSLTTIHSMITPHSGGLAKFNVLGYQISSRPSLDLLFEISGTKHKVNTSTGFCLLLCCIFATFNHLIKKPPEKAHSQSFWQEHYLFCWIKGMVYVVVEKKRSEYLYQQLFVHIPATGQRVVLEGLSIMLDKSRTFLIIPLFFSNVNFSSIHQEACW